MEQQNKNPAEDNNLMLISMILNIIKMEIWKGGKIPDNEVARFSIERYRISI